MDGKKNSAFAGLVALGAANLDQIIQYLSTLKGTDNFFEILTNVLKIVVPILHLGARLQRKAGFRKSDVSGVGERLAKLTPLIGDSRMLIRVWGVLPIIQWLLSHSKYPPATSRLLKLERWQIFTMLAYFPTEQLYYLRAHDIIPAAITLPVLGKTVALNTRKLLLASSRCYLAYIVLEFFRLKEKSGLLCAKQKALSEVNTNNVEANAEKTELKQSWEAHTLAIVSNTFRFPGALCWSLESGIPLNDVTGAVFGLVASLIAFRDLWAVAGKPSVPPPAITGDGDKGGREEKDAKATVEGAEPYVAELDAGVSESTSSYVEVRGTQA